LPLSGPWQAKQLSERIGLMSRLNEIRDRGSAGAPVASTAPHPTVANTVIASRAADRSCVAWFEEHMEFRPVRYAEYAVSGRCEQEK
jgi:hypothetical protein